MRSLWKVLLSIVVSFAVPPAIYCQTTGASYNYYFAHIATGSIWRTTFTYVNPSDSFSTCDTSFYSDSGGPLKLSFGGVKTSVLHYSIPGGGTYRAQTDFDSTGPVVTGWALGVCTGPMKASALFRSYNGSVPEAEGSVLASTSPASHFVTYSDQITGVAYANPLSTLTTITFTARNVSGQTLATKNLTLQGLYHGSFNVGTFLNLNSFQGSLEVDASSPIIFLSLDFESAPVFSSLPPGEEVSGTDFVIPIASTDVVEIQGADNQYLGLVSYAQRTGANSVFNPTGLYGSTTSPTSILNPYGNYGSSTYSDLSAFYPSAKQPPYLLINGTAVGRVTTNSSIQNAIDPWYLLGYIRGKNY